MPDKKTTCDAMAIDLLLQGRLADEERSALEEHLSDCVDCCARIERQAAEPCDWADAREFLSSQACPPHDACGFAAGSSSGPSSQTDDDLPRPDLILTHLAPTDDPRMLGRFGGYEIAGVIGHGGMGVVLKGLDVALNRYVAIKALAPHLATSAAARLRFAREARAAAAVVHENVIAIHAVSEANGLPYLVMPYLRGQSLQKRLDVQGPLVLPEILRIGHQAAAGLAAAHAQGLVHRDIKPANILLEDGIERLTITDFGLARAADDASLTRSGVIAGTPQFMSPEQARGDSIDRRSDLFSLGSVLYMLCTGRPPFRAETSYGILRRISDDHPRPVRELNPEIPDWLCAIIEKLHAKAAGDRYQSADEVAHLFEQCLAHVQQPRVVPLPESLQRLVSEDRNGAKPVGRILNPSESNHTDGFRVRPTTVVAIAAGCILLAAVAVSMRRGTRPVPSGEQPHGISAPSATSEGRVSNNNRSSSSAIWQDGVTEAIDDLNRDVFEAGDSIERFWEPATTADSKEVEGALKDMKGEQ